MLEHLGAVSPLTRTEVGLRTEAGSDVWKHSTWIRLLSDVWEYLIDQIVPQLSLLQLNDILPREC